MNFFKYYNGSFQVAVIPTVCSGHLKKPFTMNSKLHTVLYVFIIAMVVSVFFSEISYGQTVSLNEKSSNIQSVFKKVTKQTGYKFWYNNDLIKHANPVNVNFSNYTLDAAITEILQGQPFAFKIVAKTIVISAKTQSIGSKSPPTFITVTGLVSDSVGKSLPGATVAIKGSAGSMTTDHQGRFTFNNVAANTVLRISFVGYSTQEVNIGHGQLKITMKRASSELSEVIVTNGYQNFDGRNLTSSITTLKAADILVPGIFTIDQALEGRVPGLFVLNNSGEVGSAPKIRIRGTSTVLGNQEPLWVIDGVVVNDPVHIDASSINDLDFVNRLGNAVSGLNPNDIDQIDVLKDASATALYGVRAANGVIVITTKKGHNGPPVISFSSSGTFTQRPRYTDANINAMDSRQRVDLSRELIAKKLAYPATINYVGYEGALYNLYNGSISYDTFQQQVNKLETMNTDWLGTITQDALSTQNSLSISGGNNKMKYFTSFGAETQQGTVKGDQVNNYSALVKLNSNLSDRLNWDINLRANTGKRDYVASNVNALNYAYNTSRAVPAYNDDNSLYYYKKYGSFNYYNFNIVNEMNNSRDVTNSTGINLINTLSYRFSDALKGSAIFSYGINDNTEKVTYTANTYYAATLRMSEFGVTAPASSSLLPFGGELQSSTSKSYNYLGRAQLDYNKAFGYKNKNQISVTVGSEVSSQQYNGMSAVNRGYLPDRGETFAAVVPTTYTAYANWALTSNLPVVTDQLTNLLSGYFTTTYTYNKKYSLNFNTRTDYSNKFGSRSNEEFLPTWSVSGRWNAADDFFKNSNVVNVLSLRASYGSQGNILDNQTPQLIIQRGGLDAVTNEYTSSIKYYSNPNLKWEKTNQINGAIDFSLFNNAITGYVSYYYKKTDNVFVNKAVTDVNGVDSYVINSGTLVNKGIELALSFTPINNALSGGKRLVWRIDPQLGQAINSLLSNKNQNTATANTNTYTNYLAGTEVMNGQALNTFYSYQFNGLSHVNGMPMYKNDANTPANIAYLKTLTKDQLFQYVLTPSGDRVPTIQGGLSNYIAYKSISLSFNLSYSFGAKTRLLPLYQTLSGDAKSYNTSVPVPEQNVSTVFLNRWQNPGDELHTNVPGFLNGTDYTQTITHWSTGQTYNYAVNIWQMYDNSDIRVVSANFVKIKTMSIRYALPDQFCKKVGFQNASVSLSGTNLYTFASKELLGQDPEQSGFSGSIQLSPRPTYSFGINVSL